MNQELLRCAQINFENLLKAMPILAAHPYWIIAKEQLDAGLEGREMLEENLRIKSP